MDRLPALSPRITTAMSDRGSAVSEHPTDGLFDTEPRRGSALLITDSTRGIDSSGRPLPDTQQE
ncbi:hypothetical protein J6590_038685 [Homalodisca vitripennis]|nr:hypothetical protein J6590_038685 [Homalodisca vitripennis]